MKIDGVEVIQNPWVPDSRWVYEPPRNRREARKRWVVAARRRRAGKPQPLYGHQEDNLLYFIDGRLLCSPATYAKLTSVMDSQ